ncbi:MAG: N-carbamoylputrescine amidase [Desulfovibrio sp.]|nr:MAG: N-carbamoylputrescine amidase [Desulfovibrio sp.]
MTQFTVSVIQMACVEDVAENLSTAQRLVREAAKAGAGIILLPELFAWPYHCKDMPPGKQEWALPLEGHPVVEAMAVLAKDLSVVLPASFPELVENRVYNSLAMINADGGILGIYRKSHLPEGPGYHEKQWFTPGDTGFKVWQTQYGTIGVGVCWDQWFPECARALTLMGADILLYPTAIGSEPHDPELHTRPHWQRVMQGHAGANIIPVAAANRVGIEQGRDFAITFYGSSFITDPYGEMVAQAGEKGESVLSASFDSAEIEALRKDWGLIQDRRPDLYNVLVT